MAWVEIVFWLLIVPLLIFLLVVYVKSKKLYRVSYILSVFTYSMTVMYAIDAYDLGRNAILGLLALSAAIMMALGYHFHTPEPRRKRKK